MTNKPETKFFKEHDALANALQEARKQKGLTRNAVVDTPNVEISLTTLQAWETGERPPSLKGLEQLANLYDVDVTELILRNPSNRQTNTNDDSDYIYVPFYHVEASAGHGSYIDEHAKPIHNLAFRRRWAEARNFDVKQLVGLIARGDSMEPTIAGDSAIIINKAVREILDGKVHVIRIGERLWVKRTQWLPNGGLRLISDNKAMYEPMDLSKADLAGEDIEVIGEVVHVAHDLD